MDDRPDETLVREALAGHGEAFAELVRRYQDYAYGTAIGMLSDFDLARDVVQEAFLCAYRDLGKLKDAARFGGWLHGIVRNMARRALRELGRVRALAADMGGAPEIVDPGPRPDESAVDSERRQIVRQALQRLGGPNREVISLFYVDGLSYADIAGHLGVTEATVLGRLQRGRAELKKELLTMVEETFRKEPLPEDFAAQVRQLLETAAADGRQREKTLDSLAEIGSGAVDPLCEAMGDPRPMIRRVAARALCRIGDARAAAPIFLVLRSGGSWLNSALFGSGKILHIPGAREELLKIAREGERGDQYWAILALAYAKGDAEVWDCLLSIFRHDAEYTGTRCSALKAICELRPDLAPQFVVEALRDSGIRRLSGWAWWIALKGGHIPPLDLCLSGLGRTVAPNARYMAGLLVLRHGEAGIKALEELLHSGSPVEREAAAVALARQTHTEAFDVLAEGLQHGGHERKWGRIIAREVAQNYGGRLLEWIEMARPDLSRSPELAWVAAQARLAAGTATPADLVHQGPPTLRADALRKLAAQSGAAALPELRRCLAEGSPKKLAREAFWRMHELREAAEPVALEMLESPHWTERKAAVCLLRRWGKLTREQKARAAVDPHVAVRHAANWHPDWLAAAKRGHPKWAKRIAPHQE